MNFSLSDIQKKYDDGARQYNLTERIPDWLGLGRIRKRLLAHAKGEVLETGVGTGFNLRHYPADVQLTAVDLSENMLAIAKKHAESLSLSVTFRKANVQELEFPDNSFDTISESLCLCTYPDPLKALSEMVRVCKPDGKILLIEHGLSDRNWLARYQHWRADAQAKHLGCNWTREPQELMKAAGFKILSARRHAFGMFHEVIAQPGSDS